jgi:outer membrane protein assembly factor BamE (lipoprotein component of BamABCDE complex)
MIFRHNFFNFLTFFLISIILVNCQLKKTQKNHGIVFLENRYEKLIINKSNTNDAIRILGNPHTKSIKNDSDWIYIERVLVKGRFHKLGSNVVSENNVAVLSFDKFGILKDKNFFDKEKIANLKFSNEKTSNDLSQSSFVTEFLQSIRSKMYGNR